MCFNNRIQKFSSKEDKIKTIEGSVTAEIEEKRSKFIANVIPVQSVEQAEEVLKQYRKKYHDARHNCYAYIINGENVLKKASDDGEPSRTAGAPILNVLERNDLYNVIAIVTRYFGGILLGTGGLVRAYTAAVVAAIKNAKIIELVETNEMEITVTYQEFENFKHFCKINSVDIINVQYGENVKVLLNVSKEKEYLFRQ